MRHSIGSSWQRHYQLCQREFAMATEPGLGPLMSPDEVSRRLEESETGKETRDRVFPSMLSLWLFMWQIFQRHASCRAATAKANAMRSAQGQPTCSPESDAYCQARVRLSESGMAAVVRDSAKELHERAGQSDILQGRPVKIYDGSTVTMPDTPQNQAEYPQHPRQKAGLGFPIARLGVLFSLASGAVLDMATCRYKGKGQSELGMLVALLGSLVKGDVLLTDRYLCATTILMMLLQHGVDVVTRLHQSRRADFRRGRRLGKHDHIIFWEKPTKKPDWMDQEVFDALPPCIELRELKITVSQRGFRSQTLLLVTTLLDAEQYPVKDVAQAYRLRWHAELNLRSLKSVLGMDKLTTKTPAMVRKEIWAHLLAYNHIRALMVQAAEMAGISPLELSFTGALDTLNAFSGELRHATGERYHQILANLLNAIAAHRVGDRPDRNEPRATKTRPKHYPRLQQPRAQARKKTAA